MNLNKTALIVVDLQNSFTERTSELPVKGTNEEWIKNVNNYIKAIKNKVPLVIYSRDLHPKNHCSFSQWGEHCVRGTYGAEFAVDIQFADFIINKGISSDEDSYSAVVLPSKLSDESLTTLYDELERYGIENAIVFGLAGEICVKETIIDLLDFGINVFFNEECIKSLDGKAMSEVLKDVRKEIPKNVLLKEVKLTMDIDEIRIEEVKSTTPS